MNDEAWTILASGVLSVLLGLFAGFFKRRTERTGSEGSAGVTGNTDNPKEPEPSVSTGIKELDVKSRDAGETIQRGLDLIEQIKARNANNKEVGGSKPTDVVSVGLSFRTIRGLEDFLGSLGSESCKFLCYLVIAEDESGSRFDLVAEAVAAIARGDLYYNWNDPKDAKNCTVLDGLSLLKHLTGKNWKEERIATNAKTTTLKNVIFHWQRVAKTASGSKAYNHFTLPDWDPLLASVTVGQGGVVEHCNLSVV